MKLVPPSIASRPRYSHGHQGATSRSYPLSDLPNYGSRTLPDLISGSLEWNKTNLLGARWLLEQSEKRSPLRSAGGDNGIKGDGTGGGDDVAGGARAPSKGALAARCRTVILAPVVEMSVEGGGITGFIPSGGETGSFNHLIKDCDFYEKKMVEKTVWNNARRGNVTTVGPKAVVSDNKGYEANVVKDSACWIQVYNGLGPQESPILLLFVHDNPQLKLQEKGVIDSGCSRHMTRNKSYLSDYEEIDGGFVAFGGDPKGGRITGKGKISTGGLTCLFAKATLDESNLWHRRLGHINFKTLNKLVRGNLVRGLPSKIFENNHTCVACQKGKQHKASCKTKTGIKREFNVARTPPQNGVAERKNKTLIEVARTMLDDSKLPAAFWLKQLILLVMFKIGC
ncbi:ribonuclease H-like domain-containing protein [Tanacetum coccineum]